MTRIAFIITGFNPGGAVREAVLSALVQMQIDHEVVYVDDGSTDGSAEAVESLADPRLIVIRAGRVGRANALNLGIQHAHAPILAILDSDDRAVPLRARLQTDFLDARPEIAAVGGQLAVRTPDGRRDSSNRMTFPVSPSDIDLWLQRGRMPLAHPALAYRRSWFEETGGYDSTARRAEDFDLVLRGWSRGIYAALPEQLTIYRSRLFPTWRYWRVETAYSRAIYTRWSHAETGPLSVRETLPELVSSWLKWAGQGARCRLVNRTWSLD